MRVRGLRFGVVVTVVLADLLMYNLSDQLNIFRALRRGVSALNLVDFLQSNLNQLTPRLLDCN
jgi:hypothetical protein